MSSQSLQKSFLAEFLGTLLLVATVVGSGIMASNLTKDVGLQLLANGLATAAILFVLITVLAPVSGAHFNPVVSLVFALRGDMSPRYLGIFLLAQCLGGLMGTVIAHLMFGLPFPESGGQVRSGVAIWLSEVVATFVLVLAILGAVRWRPESAPVVVSLTILAAYWFTASTSFANPAVTFARGFTSSFSGIRLADVPMFVLMQGIGAMLAYLVSGVLFRDENQK